MKNALLNFARFFWRKYLYWKRGRDILEMFKRDGLRYCENLGDRHIDRREAALARIIMGYHMVEKGLTMPRRRLGFGVGAITELLDNIEAFERKFGRDDQQLQVAIGVVRSYYDLHAASDFKFENEEFARRLNGFIEDRKSIPPTEQLHFNRADFYAARESSFPEFARSRHTVRHFEGQVPEEVIKAAVELAMTAPSACNRQHVRVHCVSNHETRDEIFKLQGGNRGFGADADKILLVTTDLSDLRWAEERHDGFTNAGMFMMNLCYALHYNQIAHCILNWSVGHASDSALRTIVDIPETEVVVGIIACGKAPESFEVARSTRKTLDKILRFHQ